MLHMPTPTLMGGSDSYDADSLAYFSAMSVQPDSTRKGLIDALIRGLKADGVWAKLDILYLVAAHDSQAARLNVKAPGSYTLSLVDAPAFTMDRGYLGDGVNDSLDTGFNPSSAPGRIYARNSAHLYGYVNLAPSDAANTNIASVGSVGAANYALVPRASGSTMGRALNHNNATFGPSGSVPVSTGGRCLSRVDATNVQAYVNGARLTSQAEVSVSPTSATIALLQRATTFANLRIAAASAGGGLSDAEVMALHARIDTYLTALGAN